MTVAHVMERAKERYGLNLTADDIRLLCWDCQNKRGVLLSRFDRGTAAERWLVQLHGVAMIAIYIPSVNRIRTVLPKDTSRSRRARNFKGVCHAATA